MLPNVISCVASDQNMSAAIMQGKPHPASPGDASSSECAFMKARKVYNSPWMFISCNRWGVAIAAHTVHNENIHHHEHLQASPK
jgi:hypothetical protein